MKTQREKVLELLKQAGRQGINSFSERATALQLPTRIFELKKEGYLITTRRHKDASVDYILMGGPRMPVETPEKEEMVEVTYTKDGYDYIKFVPKSQLQETLL